MATGHLCVTILILASIGVIETHDVNDQRIDRIRGRSRKIHRQLVGIKHRNNDCNDTVYDVIDKMRDVAGTVKELYKGPYLAKLDLSDNYGSGRPDRVLVKVADPIETVIESYSNSHVSLKHARKRCIQEVIWRSQLPVDNEDSDKSDQNQILGQYDKELQGLRKYNERKNGHNHWQFRSAEGTTTTEEYQHTTQAYKFRRLLQFRWPTSRPLGFRKPSPNLRVRKEYRTLTLTERTRFHNALNVLHQRGVIREFAEVHRRGSRGAHGGPAFLPWHRVFITRFENALREVDPSVTLPYWSSTMDDCMANPVLSTMWSEDFVGNGAGNVVTGPFTRWTARDWFLERCYAQRGNLVRRVSVNRVLTRCRYNQITVPTGSRRFRIESFHNGVHIWVGGDMIGVGTAPYDPVFYLHHCYIDYIWQKFRERQLLCGNDPETDFIQANGRHNFNSRMTPRRRTRGPQLDEQGDYRVRDGMSNYWTDEIFRYEEQPSCQNNCGGSQHLYCDRVLDCCVPFSRFASTPFARPRREAPGRVNNKTTEGYNTDDCDQYLDPGCYLQTARRYSEQKQQIPIDQDIALTNNLVEKNRGERFGLSIGLTSDVNDKRNLNTVSYDKKNYDAYRQELLAEEDKARREDL